MYREKIKNALGLKALAWDADKCSFVSPARPEFVWSQGGLQMCECPRCGNEPKENCTCGLYATFDYDVALEYINHSIISPIFLVESSNITHLYSAGFRSAELTILAVIDTKEYPASMLAAIQAAEYFKIRRFEEIEQMIAFMDLQNKFLFGDDYFCRTPDLANIRTENLREILSRVVSSD